MPYLAKTTSKGHDYYKIMESYRENGKVKHRVLQNIGTLSQLFELLQNGSTTVEKIEGHIKNDGFNIELKPIRCRTHGDSFLLYSIASWIGIEEIMNQVFSPKTANSINRALSLILAAIHRACEPGSKARFEDWFSHSSLPDYLSLEPAVFTSQHFWEQMDGISYEEIKIFETTVYNRIMQLFPEVKEEMSSLSADFTNYFTYINSGNFRCTLAQLGHSKEGRSGQRIVNVAAVMSPVLGIPIATMIYEGNKNDKVALKSFFEELAKRLDGIVPLDKMMFVFDGGGVSEEALDLIPGDFITRGSLRSSPELFDVPLESFEKTTLEDGKEVLVHRIKVLQFGKTLTAIVSISDDLRKGQERELDKQTNKFFENAESLNERIQKPRSTTDKSLPAMEERIKAMMMPGSHIVDFIEITYKTKTVFNPKIKKAFEKERKLAKKENREPELKIDGILIKSENDIPLVEMVESFSCKVNEEKRNSMMEKYFGKHLLVTNKDEWETEKILGAYKDQEFIEAFFRDTKDVRHFSVRPTYHWTDQKLRVHISLCYLGLSLCRVAQYLLKKNEGYKITCAELLHRLSHVQECIVMMTVNGEQIEPQKTLNELRGADKETWELTYKIVKDISKREK